MSYHSPLTITGGRLILPDGSVKPGNLRCEGGLITALGDVAPQSGDEVHDARGKLVAPGLVDVAVFAIDKPAFHFGGITRAALMPDQNPPLDVPARVRFAAQSGKPDFWVHPLAAATKELRGESLAEIAMMRDAGARAIATGRCWIQDSGTMLRLLQYAGMLGMVVVSHAEDAGLVGKAVATAGEMATRLGLPSAPAQAEALAITRDLALAEMAGARIHFRKVTTAAGLDLVRRAKDRGLGVTAGVSPAYFMLSELAKLAAKLANYFLNRLPNDGICCWDLVFTDDSETPRDSSAAAITACGLLELAGALPLSDQAREAYASWAWHMVRTLGQSYLAPLDGSNAVLLHAVYHMPNKAGVDEACIWGDYFYLEALMRLRQVWSPYW